MARAQVSIVNPSGVILDEPVNIAAGLYRQGNDGDQAKIALTLSADRLMRRE